jgi:Ca-activated chloride channel homolog
MRTSFVGAAVLCLMAGCGAASAGSGGQRVVDSGTAVKMPASEPTKVAEAVQIAADHPEQPSKPASWVGASASSGALLAGRAEQSIAVWVDVPKAAQKVRVPLAVGFSVDTSGSMAGKKIEHARAAAQRVLDELADGDVVSLNTFSDDAVQRVQPSPLTALSRRWISGVIEELGASGGTNLFEGVRSAEAVSLSAPKTHPVRRVVVISDGRATAGNTSSHALAALAEAGLPHGVQVTAVGIGVDYDEATLNALALRSSGRLYHVADSKDLPGIVEREMGLLESTSASNAQIEIVAAPGVTLLGVAGVHANSDGSTLRVPLGSLHAGQSRELLVRVRLDDVKPSPERPLLSARLHFQDLADSGVGRVQEVVARASITEQDARVTSLANPRAQAIIAMQQAAVLANDASQQANAGNLAIAEERLAQAETELRRGAARTKDQRERERMLANAQRMSGAQQAMKAAAAAPGHARRAMGRASALEMNDAAMDLQGM